MKNVARLFRFLKPRTSRGRVLLWATIVSFLLGLIAFGLPIEELFRAQRNRLHRQSASQQLVIIAIDDRSITEVGRYPWRRSRLAEMVAVLDRMGSRQIFMDLVLAGATDAAEDRALGQTMQSLKKPAVLAVPFGPAPSVGKSAEYEALPEFGTNFRLASIFAYATPWNAVYRLPYEIKTHGATYPSLSALLANASNNEKGEFPVDYSIDPTTIPVISASDILNGRVDSTRVSGKNVLIGLTYSTSSDQFLELTYGQLPGCYLQVLGAETLLKGKPYSLGWFLPLLIAICLGIVCLFKDSRVLSITAIGGGVLAALVVPLFLEINHIFADVMPAMFLLAIVGGGFSWCSYRDRYKNKSLTNEVSGLPNLNALNQQAGQINPALVAARVHNYTAIVATLSADGERELVEQMTKRLMVGAGDNRLYQGDEGIFAWFAETRASDSMGAHLDALHTLFRSPIVVENRQFDLEITFGFDADISRLPANRLASALVAADEAHREGLKWKEHDPARMEEASWKLSLLSQLDAAIDSGDVWIAYQPKLDLRTNHLSGAEALARWTHGEKGAINPVEFILAAEQSNRIEKLTHYVLEHAIRAAAIINRHGRQFSVSVNISARLLDGCNLAMTIRKLLTKHGLAPEHLTLEVTETAAIGNAARSLATLRQLRDMGVVLSVDDYGTGMSTLDYLQRIPASEIKIDRSFVSSMQTNHATKVMVNSTIQLAHSLGQKVVAEGVEDEHTLEELRRMGCDTVQGYLIGKPMTFRALSKLLSVRPKEDAA